MSTRIELTDDLLSEALRIDRGAAEPFDLMADVNARLATTRQRSARTWPWTPDAASRSVTGGLVWAGTVALLLVAGLTGAALVIGSLLRPAFPLAGKVVVSAGYQMLFIDPATGETTVERTPGIAPTYSPDGRHIAYMVPNAPGLRIEILGADGQRQRSIALDPPITAASTGLPGSELSWSADGTRLAFDADVSGLSHAFVADRDGGAPRDLTPPGIQLGTPALAPDGQVVAVRALDVSGARRSPPRWDLWFIDAGNGRVIAKAPPLPDGFSAGPGVSLPVWFPDGSRVVIDAERSGTPSCAIFVVSRDGRDVVRLAADLNPINPYLSPNGEMIAFESSNTGPSHTADVWVVASSGTGEREIAANADVWGWSSDGTGLVYSTPSCLSVAGAGPRPCSPSLYVYWLSEGHADMLVSDTTLARLVPDYTRYGFGGASWGHMP